MDAPASTSADAPASTTAGGPPVAEMLPLPPSPQSWRAGAAPTTAPAAPVQAAAMAAGGRGQRQSKSKHRHRHRRGRGGRVGGRGRASRAPQRHREPAAAGACWSEHLHHPPPPGEQAPPVGQRKWTHIGVPGGSDPILSAASGSGGGDGGCRFRCMSYNILAQSLLEGNLALYPRCPARARRWEWRCARLLAEVARHRPSLLCMQEVEAQHLADLVKPLMERGYAWHYKQRVGAGQMDGCVSFWLRRDWELLHAEDMVYAVGGRGNIATLLALRHRGAGKVVTHTEWPTHDDAAAAPRAGGGSTTQGAGPGWGASAAAAASAAACAQLDGACAAAAAAAAQPPATVLLLANTHLLYHVP
eukprot:COSAG01_NODE_5708_length_4085_cov_6.491972_4_plen_360_part_00